MKKPSLLQLEAARTSLAEWCRLINPDVRLYPHTERVIRHLEGVIFSETGGELLSINMPVRMGKSFLTCVGAVSFYACRHPDKNVILATHAAHLAEEHSREAKRAVEQWGEAVFGVKVSQESRSVGRWSIEGGRGSVLACGVDAALSGHGGHLIIVDDPHTDLASAENPDLAQKVHGWFHSVAMKRRSVLPPKGSVIVCGTRYATGDLWARLQEDEAKGGEVWSRLVLPLVDLSGEATIETGALLCPEMVGREEARKRSLRREFWAMDQQQPFDAETALIRASYLQRRYAARPERVERVVLAVDLAFKDHKSGSRCAFQAWAKEGPDFYLLDQVVGHMTAPKAIATIKHLARKWPTATVLIEDKANGPAVAQLLKEEISGIVTVTPQRSKVDRVHAILKLFEGGNVVLPESALHAWVDEFISEAVRFPNGDKDDLVDACSMALHRLLTSGPVSYYGGDSRFWDTPTLIHGGVGGYDGGRRAMTERPDHSSDWTSPSRRTGEWF